MLNKLAAASATALGLTLCPALAGLSADLAGFTRGFTAASATSAAAATLTC